MVSTFLEIRLTPTLAFTTFCKSLRHVFLLPVLGIRMWSRACAMAILICHWGSRFVSWLGLHICIWGQCFRNVVLLLVDLNDELSSHINKIKKEIGSNISKMKIYATDKNRIWSWDDGWRMTDLEKRWYNNAKYQLPSSGYNHRQ